MGRLTSYQVMPSIGATGTLHQTAGMLSAEMQDAGGYHNPASVLVHGHLTAHR